MSGRANSTQGHRKTTVAIVGGGLAGLSAATALVGKDFHIELFEARRKLGGRAGSYFDSVTGNYVDHCQHVAMGCCTTFMAFCEQTGIAKFFERYKRLHFFGLDGRRYDLAATAWLPPPLHLGPSLLRQGYLTWKERVSIARTLLKLRSVPSVDDPALPTVGVWLRQQGQTEQAIRRFWSVVLVSALGESLERASLTAARKVFVEGFMNTRDGYEVFIPTVPLETLYEQVSCWLVERGAQIHLGMEVDQILPDEKELRTRGLRFSDHTEREFDFVIAATSWRRVQSLFAESFMKQVPELRTVNQIVSSPISSLHLWFDRSITPLPHAVLVDRLSQWVFSRGDKRASAGNLAGHYYQVVISASHDVRVLPREQVLSTVLEELKNLWPTARDATLLHWRMLTDPDAVFSVQPGFDTLRPEQQTSIDNLMLAGDWTKTNWPATMESAVRSGQLAARAIKLAVERSA